MMVAEIREIGDKLVVYTDDNRLYRIFDKRLRPLFQIPYAQNGKVVGIDFYFDRKFKNTIIQVIKGQLMLDL